MSSRMSAIRRNGRLELQAFAQLTARLDAITPDNSGSELANMKTGKTTLGKNRSELLTAHARPPGDLI